MAQQICTNTYAVDYNTMYPYENWIGNISEPGEYMSTVGTYVYAMDSDEDDTLAVFTPPMSRSTSGLAYWDNMGHVSFGPTAIPYAVIINDNSITTTGPTDTELNDALEDLGTELDSNDLSTIEHGIYGKYGSFMVGTDWGVEVTDELQYCHLRVSPTVCRYRSTGIGLAPSGRLGRLASSNSDSNPVLVGEIGYFRLPPSLSSSYTTSYGNYICTGFAQFTGETPITAAGYSAYGYTKRGTSSVPVEGGIV